MNGIGDFDTVGGHSVLIRSDLIAIEKYVACLAHPLEFEENLAA